MEKSIIIIGGGLTGLSAGCYGRMNGYKTRIFEMHSACGGVATAWKRKGYIIDGAMNWLMGTKPGTGYHKVWEELGAAPGWKIRNHEINGITEDKEGRSLAAYCDADKFAEYLLKLAPEDEKPILELAKMIRALYFNMPVGKPRELSKFFDLVGWIKMLPLMRSMSSLGKLSAREYADRFTNPFLREMLPRALGGDIPLLFSLWQLALQHHKMAGYVLGGAIALVKPIEERYTALGGELRMNARVEKILVENDRAVGVRLTDGSEYRSDWVVSAADGRSTIFDMLEGRYLDDAVRNRYQQPKLFTPLVYVALGVDRDFNDVPPSINGTTYPLDMPIMEAGREHSAMNIRVYNFDPNLAPQGKNVAVVSFGSDYDYWKKLSQDSEAYGAEKERIFMDVVNALEQRFPGISRQIEMHDVATPLTWERYTGNWRGAYEGWMFDKDVFTSSMRKTLPGLDRFYMAGQWVNPGGGMPTAVISGNHTIQLICNRDKRRFVGTVT